MHRAQLFTFAFCVSVLSLSGDALAAEKQTSLPALARTTVPASPGLVSKHVRAKPVDLRLIDGQFSGQVVDGQGKAVAGAKVLLAGRSRIVSATKADAAGRFNFCDQKPGVVTLSVGGPGKTLRLWDSQMAPPAAIRQLQFVCDGAAIMRAQCCSAGASACGGCDSCCASTSPGFFGGAFQHVLRNPWIVGVGTAAAIAIPLATDDDDDNSSGEAGASGESPDAS